MSRSPNSSVIRARRQRKLTIQATLTKLYFNLNLIWPVTYTCTFPPFFPFNLITTPSHLLQFTVWILIVKMLVHAISFFLESARKSASDHHRQRNGEWGLTSLFWSWRGRGWGHSLIWPIRVCAAEQGMVFKVLSLKQGMQFHYWAS